MKTTRKFRKMSDNDHEAELGDLKRSLFSLALKIRDKYSTMTIEEYDKYHRIRKDLEGVEKMLELGSFSEIRRLLMFMSEDSKSLVPVSIISLVKQ